MGNSRNISAILGPTNTGKTHITIERMLEHTSGMMGFPLRLLARENYDKVAAIKGRAQVALITGEEQIVPENPRYFICTVEAMPLDKSVEFLAVDEIQLASDPDRGHIFTDRLLNARGISETMFIGSDTMTHLLKRMIPSVDIKTRERFSKLSYAGYKKIVRLPTRSAIVAFSAADVYALAEFMRRQRGGTAVVMGALSPRARNAQVGMYQAGEVDFIVATDAIGMGLNMDIDHVAFSTIRKFDGRQKRVLRPGEMGQIAGRAGRYTRDGTFGTTADEGSLPDYLVEKIENHKFDPVHFVWWRNSDLDFSSIEELRHSLNVPPPRDFYKKPQGLEDQEILDVMFQHKEIRKLAQGYEPVKLLWEICQVPDYRKLLTEVHARFLMQVYHYLLAGEGRIPQDWVQQQVSRLDRYDGDMDAIMSRLAHIRMWTYISNRQEWLHNQSEWQERTRDIEDKLSDALHMELTQRFVDKRVAVLMKKLDENAEFTAEVSAGGDVLVEGQFVGKLQALRFAPDQEVLQNVAKGIRVAARKAVLATLPKQVDKILADGEIALSLARNNEILWQGKPLARLSNGKSPLQPNIKVLVEEEMDPVATAKVQAMLEAWLEKYIHGQLFDLLKTDRADLSAGVRGVLYQLREHMGCVPINRIKDVAASLSEDDKKALDEMGVTVGECGVFYHNLYAPKQTHLRLQLWALSQGRHSGAGVLAGKLQIETDEKISAEDAWAAGYMKFNRIYIRADKLERLSQILWDHLTRHKPLVPNQWKNISPLDSRQLLQVAEGLGFTAKTIQKGSLILTGRRKKNPNKDKKNKKPLTNSPFAGLAKANQE